MKALLYRDAGDTPSPFTLPSSLIRFPDVILLGELCYVLRVVRNDARTKEGVYYVGDVLRLFDEDHRPGANGP